MILFAGFLLAACSSSPKAEADQAVETSDADIEWTVVKLEVEGMTCDGCEKAIQAGVGSLEGIASVESSHEEGWTEVKYDASSTSLDDIKSKITDTGYTVKAEL